MRTARLELRPPVDEDGPRFVELFRDPAFMVFSGGVLDGDEAAARFDAMRALAQILPFAKQPVVERATRTIVGYAGVDLYRLHGRPVLEFGWRLIPEARGRGYATEAATALVAVASEVYDGEIVTMIAPANRRSARVAQKVGFGPAERAVVEGDPTDISRLRCRGTGLDPDVVTFRPMTVDDLALMATWLGADHVQEWWRDPSAPDRVDAKYGPRLRPETNTEMFVIDLFGHPIGFVQRYLLRDHPDWARTLTATGLAFERAAGIDYAIGDPRFTGRGLGSALIGDFVDRLFDDHPDVNEVIVTPQAANRASCRVLEKAGFSSRWTGRLASSDPGDAGTAALYVRTRSMVDGSR